MYITVSRSVNDLGGRSLVWHGVADALPDGAILQAMLILTRKADEHIRIGSDITISVFEIEGNRVKIGVDAPRGVKILRSELEERPDENKADSDGFKRAA